MAAKSHLMLAAASLVFVSCAKYQVLQPRPGDWAEPVALEGVANLHRVDRNLYRSAQPTPEGMKALEKYGIRTVVNLRMFGDDEEEVVGTGLRRVDIPMLAWMPRAKSARRFIETVSEESEGPFLVHCYHGSDRTGSMVALYRASVRGWETDQAVEEMLHGGFGFHRIWQNLIRWTRRQA